MFYNQISRTLSMWDGLARWYEDSILKIVVDHIGEHWFAVKLGAYEYIPVTAQTAKTARMLIVAMMLGIILASAITLYTKRRVGAFVRKLKRMDAYTRENAKTLMELGFFRSSQLRYELRRGKVLRKYVRCVEEEDFQNRAAESTDAGAEEAPFEMDFSSMHFYLSEEQKYTAEVRYEQRGSGWLSFGLTVAITVLVAALFSRFLPVLLQFADWIISMTAPK